jgi:FkbM family methyltransferase
MLKEVAQKFLKNRNVFLYNSEGSRDRDLVIDLKQKIVLNSKGVLHLGAHNGQERYYYAKLGASVIWIEAIPDHYKILLKNIQEFSNQIGMLALLGSVNKKDTEFNLASNDGQSSSIYSFGDDTQFKNLHTTKIILLTMKRLDNLLSKKQILDYTHWVIDVQGAELEVLKGAGKLLDYCYSLQVEVTSRDLYRDGANAQKVIDFLLLKGFINLQEHRIGYHEDLLFIRIHK